MLDREFSAYQEALRVVLHSGKALAKPAILAPPHRNRGNVVRQDALAERLEYRSRTAKQLVTSVAIRAGLQGPRQNRKGMPGNLDEFDCVAPDRRDFGHSIGGRGTFCSTSTAMPCWKDRRDPRPRDDTTGGRK
jgi:hypothetical protein